MESKVTSRLNDPVSRFVLTTLRLVSRVLTLVANSRRRSMGRNVGKMESAGKGKPRPLTPRPNSPPVSVLGLPERGPASRFTPLIRPRSPFHSAASLATVATRA